MEKEFNLTKAKKEALKKAGRLKSNFDCSNCSHCDDCSHCSHCDDCSHCSHCDDCSCYDCFDKKYMICNTQFTKEEYETWIKQL